jgi:predicted ATPase/DNA-binding CsgD family transcriptional regulator
MTPNTALHNLPAEPNDFIGRERDVAELRQLLAATRAVSLCGPGGIGKTRLALRVAASLVDDCPDGVWFAGLGELPAEVTPEVMPGDADPVTRRVTAILGIADEPGRPPDDTLADALRTRDMLLVLDNCEHLIDVCARFCRRLLASCPRVRILATSREPLRVPGENVWRVPPLATPGGRDEALYRNEAVRLFAARAAAARPSFSLTEGNAAAIGDLCRALDGVPLAIELAAARTRVLSVEEITRRLRDRFRLLSAGDRTAPPRQRTLRGTIDWSHELLSEPERALFRRLSVFAGWTLDQAEQVCADAEMESDPVQAEDVLDLLTALVDKSLVVVDAEIEGKTRFRLLDSIRAYAAGRLAVAGEAGELRRRHRDVVLEAAEYNAEIALAERAAPWAVRVGLFRRYDEELDNVRAALAWSLERGDVEEGLRLSTALRSYCLPRGYFAECEDWLDRFLAGGAAEVGAGPRQGVGVNTGGGLEGQGGGKGTGGGPEGQGGGKGTASPRVRGAALVGRAQLAIGRRDFDGAARFAADGLGPCRAAGDDVMVAAALDVLGQAELRAGRFGEAAGRFGEAIAVARRGGDQWNEGLALISRGAMLAAQNRLRDAQHAYESGLRLMRHLDQRWGSARALIGLGQLARLRGDPTAARAYYEEALPSLRAIDAGPEIARCLSGLGRVALDQGDTGRARQALTESLNRSHASGLRLGVARGLEAFAELVALEGQPADAVRLGGAAAALRDAIGHASLAGVRLERLLDPIRRKLGDQLVAQLWGEGRDMTPETAVARALRTLTTGSVPAQRPPVDDQEVPRSTVSASPVTPPSTLTPREREIAALIARGLSNKGIADELVISPATVARHVTNILTKLGFNSRAQIAAWAVERGHGTEGM